ncbi:MAG: LysR substrate-binding domain-containing protein [Panacagrimonas sp.]
MLPKLAAILHETAPHIVLNAVRHGAENLREQLERGQVDVAIGLLPDLAGGFFRQRLFRQGYVVAFRGDHPLAARPALTLDDFVAHEHAVVVVPGTGHGEIDRLMRRKGIERHVRLTVPHFNALGHILSTSDLIATLPERFVERIRGPFGLSSARHPVKLPQHTIDLYWHAKVHKDPANQWLRRLIYDTFADH